MGVENAGASVEHFGGRSVSCGEAISSVTFVIATLASVPGTGPSRARHVSQTLGARSAATARRRSRHPTNFHRYDQLDIEWTFQMGFGHEVWEVTVSVSSGFYVRNGCSLRKVMASSSTENRSVVRRIVLPA
jgi:hypothetical protein